MLQKALSALSSMCVLNMVEIANLYLNDGFFSQCAALESIVMLPFGYCCLAVSFRLSSSGVPNFVFVLCCHLQMCIRSHSRKLVLGCHKQKIPGHTRSCHFILVEYIPLYFFPKRR